MQRGIGKEVVIGTMTMIETNTNNGTVIGPESVIALGAMMKTVKGDMSIHVFMIGQGMVSMAEIEAEKENWRIMSKKKKGRVIRIRKRVMLLMRDRDWEMCGTISNPTIVDKASYQNSRKLNG
ncbi:hypothetical protein OIU77_006071, partial [Salix suchowensis]